MKSEKFKNLINEDFGLEKIYTGTIWAEGPVWMENENLIVWSDVKSLSLIHISEPTRPY